MKIKTLLPTLSILSIPVLASSVLASSIPPFRAFGARSTPIQNVLYQSPVSSYPNKNYGNSIQYSAVEARFHSATSLDAIKTPTLNTSFLGGSERSLVAQFACPGDDGAIQVGVTKGVYPTAWTNQWGVVDPNNSTIARSVYSGWFIRLTTQGQQYQINLPYVPTPSPGAGMYKQVQIYRSTSGYRIRIWDSATAVTQLDTVVGNIVCGNGSSPTYIHNSYVGAQITTNDPNFTIIKTWKNQGFRYEQFGNWLGNTFNGSLPNKSIHVTPGWLGSPIEGYKFALPANPTAANTWNNITWSSPPTTPDPNITQYPIPTPVSPPVPIPPNFGDYNFF